MTLKQKPAVTSAATDHPLAAAAAAAAAAKSREEELKRAADTNGGKTFEIISLKMSFV